MCYQMLPPLKGTCLRPLGGGTVYRKGRWGLGALGTSAGQSSGPTNTRGLGWREPQMWSERNPPSLYLRRQEEGRGRSPCRPSPARWGRFAFSLHSAFS